MNDKINQQFFVDLLAEKHNLNKHDAENFVREFFFLIKEGLANEKLVKVKGLGTFKLVEVDSRESINIHTGERFEIQGYEKVTFTPENSLRELINRPFEHFDTVLLNDGVTFDDTPEEIDGEDTEEEVVAVNEQSDDIAPQTESEHVVEEAAPEEDTPEIVTSEISAASETAEETPVVEEPIEKESIADTAIEEPEPEPVEESTAAIRPVAVPKPVKSHNKLNYLLIIVIISVLACVGAVAYMYFPEVFTSDNDNSDVERTADMLRQIVVTDTIVETPSDTLLKKVEPELGQKDDMEVSAIEVAEMTMHMKEKDETPSQPKQTIEKPIRVVEKVVPAADAANAPVHPDSVNYKITGTKATYTLQPGETLTRVSLRFYGTKDLYPYIVRHNLDVIKNPNNIPSGITLKIPELVKK
jgi:nucleoid DNA-binding protein